MGLVATDSLDSGGAIAQVSRLEAYRSGAPAIETFAVTGWAN